MIVAPTLHPRGTYRPEAIKAAVQTTKTVGPSKLEQVISAGMLRSKPRLEHAQISGIIFLGGKRYRLWVPESSK